jgi:hypothetical protein
VSYCISQRNERYEQASVNSYDRTLTSRTLSGVGFVFFTLVCFFVPLRLKNLRRLPLAPGFIVVRRKINILKRRRDGARGRLTLLEVDRHNGGHLLLRRMEVCL